jgi:hypothetical protein
MVTDSASLAANWRLFCPARWDDTTLDDPAAAEAVRARRVRAGILDEVRHRESGGRASPRGTARSRKRPSRCCQA